MDPQLINIVVAISVILITLVLYLLYKKRQADRRFVLVTGVCDTGKTLLYARLVHDKFVNSHTSIRENVGEYATEKGTIAIVDIPGHERLRNKYLEQYKKMARALIYVIDSSNFKAEVRDVAEYLYNLLTDATIYSNCRKVLILCNKQDLPLVKGMSIIKQLLEKEMDTVRMTKASQLDSTEEVETKNTIVLGDENSPFDFSHCGHYQVDFAEGYSVSDESASGAPYDLKAVENWLTAVA